METYILLFSRRLVWWLDSWGIHTRKVSGWITPRFCEPEPSWNLPLRTIVIPRNRHSTSLSGIRFSSKRSRVLSERCGGVHDQWNGKREAFNARFDRYHVCYNCVWHIWASSFNHISILFDSTEGAFPIPTPLFGGGGGRVAGLKGMMIVAWFSVVEEWRGGGENGTRRSYSPVSVNSIIYNHSRKQFEPIAIFEPKCINNMHEIDLFNHLWGQRVWRITYIQSVCYVTLMLAFYDPRRQ